MPCFTQEKSLSFRPRRDKTNERDVLAPKPVRARNIRYHGLFGMSIATQHLIVDDNWTPSSVAEQFAGLSDLLSRRVIYKRHETETNRRRLLAESKRLKLMCTDGRMKLQKISTLNNSHKIRNFLILHRDMQRLYQSMPIHLVVDNINQRTFVLRKERDRLEHRLSQRQSEYRELLLYRARVENLIKYENEFVLEEELRSRVLLKKIENSNVRLKAIKTINTTYRKMVQVLLNDEIFYEPILRSLDADMEEQSNFIKHILYLGMPAIAKFKELSHEYHMLVESSRKNLHAKLEMLASLRKPPAVVGPPHEKGVRETTTEDIGRFVRNTKSMIKLKEELVTIEKIIKELKFLTLCSQAKEIYPRVKGEMQNNITLHRQIENDIQAHQNARNKMKYANLLQGVLVNNLSEEQINREEHIKDLKMILKNDEEFAEYTLAQIKNRADAYVLLRLGLWNLVEILRHVDRAPKSVRNPFQYPNSYLKLPLLKFEMMNMYAAAPVVYEEDIAKIMHCLKRQIYKLMKGYKPEYAPAIAHSRDVYHATLLNTLYREEINEDDNQMTKAIDDDDDKAFAYIPSRKLIKAQSARVVEEASKRDED